MAVPEEAVDGGRAYAGRFLAAVFLMMGLSGLFVPAFPSVSCGWVIPGICGTSICLGIFLLAGYSKGRQAAVLIPYLLFAGIFYGRIRDGFLILSNDMLHFMTEKTGKIYLDFQVNAEGNVYFTLFSIGFLAAFLTANAIWYGTLWPVSPVIFLVAAALISGFSREVIAAAVFLAGLLLIPIFREQMGRDKEEKENLPAYAAVIAVSLVLLLTAGTFLGRMDLFQENWWKDSVHRFLYDSSTESMPEGNLENLGSWKKSDAAALSLKADQYGKLYLRGVIRENYTGTAWAALHQKGIRDELEQYGIDIISTMDAHFDPALQNMQLESIKMQHPDAVIAIPTDDVQTGPAFQELSKMTRLIFLSNVPQNFSRNNYVSCISVNERENGTNTGRMIGEYLKEKPHAKVGFIIHGAMFYGTTERDNCAEKILRESYPDIEITARKGFIQIENAYKVCYEMINEHPDIQALYVSWDRPALLAIKALKALNRTDIAVFTTDLDFEIAEEMNQGFVKGLSTQRPYDQGKAAALAVAKSLVSDNVPKYIGVQPYVVHEKQLKRAWKDIFFEALPEELGEKQMGQ